MYKKRLKNPNALKPKKPSNNNNTNPNAKDSLNTISEFIVNSNTKSFKKVISIYEKFKNKALGISFYIPEIKTIFSGEINEQDFIFLEYLFEEMEFDLFLLTLNSDANAKISLILKKISSAKIKNLNFFYFNYSEISYCLKSFLEAENTILASYMNANSDFLTESQSSENSNFTNKNNNNENLNNLKNNIFPKNQNENNHKKNSLTTELHHFHEISLNTKLISILDNLNENAKSSLYVITDILQKALTAVDFVFESPFDFLRINFEKIEFLNSLLVSKKALKDLKVFDEKAHPSQIKGKGRAKEGVSLFGLFNRCATAQGKKLVKQIFLCPLKNFELILPRQRLLNDFSGCLRSSELLKAVLRELALVKDLDKVLKELKNFIISKKFFKFLFQTLESFFNLENLFRKELRKNNSTNNNNLNNLSYMNNNNKNITNNNPNFNNNNNINTNYNNNKFSLLNDILKKINLENLTKIYDFIENCIEFTCGEEEDEKIKLKPGVNEDLDALRTEYNSLHEVLSAHAIEYAKNIPQECFMEKFMFIFLPQLGYMLAVEKNAKYKFFVKKSYDMYQNIVENFALGGSENKSAAAAAVNNIIVGNLAIDIVCNFDCFGAAAAAAAGGESGIVTGKDLDLLENKYQVYRGDVLGDNRVAFEDGEEDFIGKEGGNGNCNWNVIFSQALELNTDNIKNKVNKNQKNKNKKKKNNNNNKKQTNDSSNSILEEAELEIDDELDAIYLNSSAISNDFLEANVNKNNNNNNNNKNEEIDEAEEIDNEKELAEIEENFDLTNSEETEILSKIVFKDVKLDFQFHTENMVYFKNELASKLDAEFGDLSAKITDIENAIFRQLSREILKYEQDLIAMNDFLSNFDAYLNFALISDKFDLHKPLLFCDDPISEANNANGNDNDNDNDIAEFRDGNINKSFNAVNSNNNINNNNRSNNILNSNISAICNNHNKNIQIKNQNQKQQQLQQSINPNDKDFKFREGRNILCELIKDRSYIPSNFNSNNKNIFLIAGNFSSGKSVFLKLIGNLVYLAHLGLNVPAANFTSKIFHRIFTVIENTENSIDNLSGFTTELKDMKAITDFLQQIKENLSNKQNLNDYNNTLILLDDPFKRTSVHNKFCLLGGFLKFLNDVVKMINKVFYLQNHSVDFPSCKFDDNCSDNVNNFGNSFVDNVTHNSNMGERNFLINKQFEKANFKVFITINKECLQFLLDNKLIDFEITEVFSFDEKICESSNNQITNNVNSANDNNSFINKSLFTNENKETKNFINPFNKQADSLLTNKSFVNLYKLKNLDYASLFNKGNKDELDGSFILLAKEFGLDLNLFYGSMSYLEEFKNNRKLLPRFENHHKAILIDLKMKSYLIKSSKNYPDMYQRIKEVFAKKGY